MSIIYKLVHSKIIHNILALGFVQIINYILPLLLIPYLLLTLGVNAWGKIVFVQFILQYFIVLVAYGFQWSAVNKISPIRKDLGEVNRLFSGYWYAQLILLGISFLILMGGVLLIGFHNDYNHLFFISFLSVVGVVFFPVWLLQSLEELKIMALMQLLAQLFCFAMIFIFVKSEKDINYAMLFQSIHGIIAGILCIIFLYNKGIRLMKYNWSDIKTSFADGFVLFKSQVWITLYTNTIPVILGFVSTTNDVATYALADRIQKAIRFVLNPISRAIFPRVSYLYKNHDKQSAIVLLKYSVLLTISIGIIGCVCILIFATDIVKFLGGEALILAPLVVKIFSIMPLLVGLSSMLSVQWLIPIGKEKTLHNIWCLAALMVLIISYPLFSSYGVLGAAYLVVVTEIMIVLAIIFLLKKGGGE